jgi:hypothetical protein
MSSSDATFLESVGITRNFESDSPRANDPAARDSDAYEAFIYWRSQALRYERIATYSWGAWLIAICGCCITAILSLTHP